MTADYSKLARLLQATATVVGSRALSETATLTGGVALSASPAASPVLAYLEGLHERLASLRDGTVATYIPELGRASFE